MSRTRGSRCPRRGRLPIPKSRAACGDILPYLSSPRAPPSRRVRDAPRRRVRSRDRRTVAADSDPRPRGRAALTLQGAPTVSDRGIILWFTGLSGAGKSHARRAASRPVLLRARTQRRGDSTVAEVRTNLSKGLGFCQGGPRHQHPAHRLRSRGCCRATASPSSPPPSPLRRHPRRGARQLARRPRRVRRDPRRLLHRGTDAPRREGLYEKAPARRDRELHRHLRPLRGPRAPRGARQLRDAGRGTSPLGDILAYLESHGLVAATAGAAR